MKAVWLGLVGFLARLALGVVLALVVALVLALLRGGSFAEGLRVSVWIVGCLLLLLAAAGHSPAMRSGTNDPWLTSFAPKLVPRLAEPYDGTRLSSSALFVLAALGMFGIGIALA